jgi:hypothetical protein
LADADVAQDLCCRNPQAVATGGAVRVGRQAAKPIWTRWFRRTFTTEHAVVGPID